MKFQKFLFLVLGFILGYTTLNANPIPSGSGLSIIGPTTISQPGNYRLANDIAGPIIIDADNVSLDLENKKITAGSNGILVSGHRDVIIKNGVVENGSGTGIFVDTCMNIEILNVDLSSNATGIHIFTTTCAVIDYCTARDHSDNGIVIDNSNSCKVSNNKLINNGTVNSEAGIQLRNSASDNLIISNICTQNLEGICLANANNNTITLNLCNNNRDEGLDLDDSSNNIIFRNTCNGNSGNGVEDTTGTNNIFKENTFNNNAGSGFFGGVSYLENNVASFNGGRGILITLNGGAAFSNKARENSLSNYAGISNIAVFDISLGDFVITPTIFVNISIVA